ncbi:uncharacterized protein DUF2147 [Algoriphagus ratkowskyi]|uniref:DUF2147 domain-containing protein n=1 Tax=Algoriphagus ratkowskyi TaxID=57028 RepID=A0A2W7RCN4_9BACT|nr:DUF2147 domain-containing protein [Algoriphagus ratkowskyi]PZX56886.1 uncharacterized protein DUF2147 [Algoriphagus ratkowskyi]TXD79800.1 DUF2147 domain-containing protein [Algoriphagus ratkowskyi]
MKPYLFALICFFSLGIGLEPTQAQSNSKILGVWFNSQKTTQIEILEKDDQLIGKIIWIKYEEGDPETYLDLVNSDTSLRNRPLMGLTILEGLEFNNGIWSEGKIYDPKSGISYACELQLKKKDILEIKGFLGESWVSRTVEWNRVKK